MANHATTRLPWPVPEELMQLMMKEIIRAAFGGLYHISEHSPLSATSMSKEETQVWSDHAQHVEMRYGVSGFDQLVQALSFKSLSVAFGAVVTTDDGIGTYELERPEKFSLISYRRIYNGYFAKDLDGMFKKSINNVGGGVIKAILGSFGAPNNKPFLKEESSVDSDSIWGFSGDDLTIAKQKLDAVFFNPPPINDLHAVYQPGPARDEYLKYRETDVLDLANKLRWAEVFDQAYPADRLDAKTANRALLPSAAFGIALSQEALKKSSEKGIEKALSIALVWGNPFVAKELYESLVKKSEKLESSEASVLKHLEKMAKKRAEARKEQGRETSSVELDASKALFEALLLAHQARPAEVIREKAVGVDASEQTELSVESHASYEGPVMKIKKKLGL